MIIPLVLILAHFQDAILAFVTTNLYSILFFLYITFAVWMFLVNYSLGEDVPWVSFIPWFQIYSVYEASNKSIMTHFMIPLAIVILWYLFKDKTWSISIYLSFYFVLVIWIIMLHSISLRLGRWIRTTVGLIFLPFVMFPYIWFKSRQI